MHGGGEIGKLSFYSLLYGKMIMRFFPVPSKITWIFPNAFNELISAWWISGFNCFLLFIWRALLGVICWGLWKEWNSRIFE